MCYPRRFPRIVCKPAPVTKRAPDRAGRHPERRGADPRARPPDAAPLRLHDPLVLAGAGVTGLEIAEDLPEVDAVIVPVGRGGLMCGVVCAIKALLPRVRTIAVELEAGPGLRPALEAGKPVPVARPARTLA